MKCAEIQPNLEAFVLGGLEPEEVAQTQHHLASCPSCQDELKELEEIGQALKAAPPPVEPPAYLKTRSFLGCALRKHPPPEVWALKSVALFSLGWQLRLSQ